MFWQQLRGKSEKDIGLLHLELELKDYKELKDIRELKVFKELSG
jgi:hypothetical protein